MRQSNSYTFFFVVIISFVSALILSFASQTLKERKEANQIAEMRSNILSAVGLWENGTCTAEESSCGADVDCCFKENIKSFAVNAKGEKVEGVDPETINFEKQRSKPEAEQVFPVFTRLKGDKVETYCIPLAGKGLWGSINGYMALKDDLNTVFGVTFYKHVETPGLGAEIENDWFLDNYKGKKILDETGNLVSVTIVKGQVTEKTSDPEHKVDGISGATITGDKVNQFMKTNLATYEPFFKTVRKEND